jgi:nucleoside-diphosphate-sugar epimerase
MKRVLVTGAGGFIGSNMVNFLLENTEYFIYGIDNFINGEENKCFIENLVNEKFIFINDDFVNFDFTNKNIDIVYHFAAMPSVGYSVENPLITNNNNVTKTLILLKNCSENRIKKFVFSSTSAIYGDTVFLPTPETTSINFKSPYAVQKLIIEQYLKIWSELYQLDSVCLRYFNVYGPNQYATNSYANVICAWMKGFITNSEIRLDGDGSQSRSFVFVKDVCKANFIMGEYNNKLNGNIFNVSNDKTYDLIQIKEIMSDLLGTNPIVLNAPKREGDVSKTHADIEKIKKYGFEPDYELEQGLIETFKWYKPILNKSISCIN